MPALGRHPCGLQPGRPAAHDQDPSGPFGRREAVAAPFPLAACRGIDEAGDPVVAKAPAPAHLVAGEAGADVVRPARPGLVGQMRVGDLAAHDRDHVGLARGHDVFGVLRRADVALGLHLHVPGHRLQRLGVGGAQLVGEEHGRDQAREIEIAAGAAGHVVGELPLVVPGHDLLQLLDRERGLDLGVQVDREADDEVLAGQAADPAHDLRAEPDPVLEAAAPAVVAAVGGGRPELVDQRVIGREQLDPIEPRLLGPPCRLDVALDHLLDLGLAHPVAAVRIVERGQPRWRPAGLEGVVEVAVLADMVELMQDHRPFRVHRIGDLAKVRDHLVARVPEIAAREHRRGMHGHRLDHDHPGTAQGSLAIVAQMPRPRQAVLGHVGRMRAEHDAVAQGLVPDGQRREQMREGVSHSGSPPRAAGRG